MKLEYAPILVIIAAAVDTFIGFAVYYFVRKYMVVKFTSYNKHCGKCCAESS